MRSLRELSDLRGRVALITGGGGHIGRVMAESLAELGATIAIIDVSEDSCKKIADQLTVDFSVDTLPIVVDLADENAIRNIPTQVVAQFGQLDILINNAAFVGTSTLKGWVVPFLEQSSDTWRSALEVNLTAPFILSQICAPDLAKSKSGVIVNVSSIYGMVGPDMSLYDGTPMGNPAAYGASKGGILQFTRWLATVLAPDIRVNAITPGGVWRQQNELFHQRYVERTPLKRMATEEDFKGAIAYLSSDLSNYVTGHNLVVDGGWTIW